MTTKQLATKQLVAYVKNPDEQKGYLTVPKRLLVQIQAHLELMQVLAAMQPAIEQIQQEEANQ